LALLIVGLVILLVIILVLTLPVYIEIALAVHGRVNFRLRVFCFFRLLRWEIGKNPARQQKRRPSAGKESRHTTVSQIYRLIRIRGLWNRVWLLIKRLFRAITIRKLESDFRFSLGDDYYTGMFIGLSLPAILFLNAQLPSELNMVPAFEEDPMLEGDLTGVVAVMPIRILAPAAAFLFSQPALEAAWTMVRGK
jgi:hypothetical protein